MALAVIMLFGSVEAAQKVVGGDPAVEALGIA